MAHTTEVSVEEKLRALYDLQIIGSRLDEIRNTRGELPIEVEDLGNEIEGLKNRSARFTAEVATVTQDIKTKKDAIKNAQTLIAKYKKQQDNVRNNKEFDALAKEIEYQELEVQLLDKKIKEITQKVELKKQDLKDLKVKIDQQEIHLNFKREELDQLVQETEQEEAFLLEKEQEYTQPIDSSLLKSYLHIRNNSANRLAIVRIERGAAKGSYFTIPPQMQIEVAQRKKIIIDEYTGKILVDDELAAEETLKMKEILVF